MAELHVLETVRDLDQKEIVTLFEVWLERARKGEIVAVAVAAVMADGSGAKGWMTGPHANALVGSIALLQARVVDEINATATKV